VKTQHLIVLSAAILACVGLRAPSALAWGEEGHRVIALIADHYLTPEVKQKVDAMLAADTDTLTKHDIASEAIWAETYRNFDKAKTQADYADHETWHSLKLELGNPDIDASSGAARRDTGIARTGGVQPG
jgi:hypothetical protein